MCDATGARDTDGGSFHLAFECSNTYMREASATVAAAASGMVKDLCSDILAALEAARVTRLVHKPLIDAVGMALERVAWNNEDGKHVLYRLLMVTPCSAAAGHQSSHCDSGHSQLEGGLASRRQNKHCPT